MSLAGLLAIALALAAPEASAPAAAATAPAGAAPAAAAPEAAKVRAVVHLRDGGLVRGTVKRLRLGKSITLTLPSGKSITLDDEDVVELQIYGRGAPADAGAAPPEPAKGETFAEQPIAAPKPASPWTSARPAAAPAAAPPAAASSSSSKPGARPVILPQPAPVSGFDTVYLEGGGLLRGTVESEKPDLVLRLVSGRKRTIAGKDVKSIVRRGAASTIDTAFLTDGSVLRGAVESEKPDLVIRLLSGKRRTVPAASVQRIERGRKP